MNEKLGNIYGFYLFVLYIQGNFDINPFKGKKLRNCRHLFVEFVNL